MKQVKDTMHKAFWELLREQLNNDPPEYTQAMILLSEIRTVSNIFFFIIVILIKKIKLSYRAYQVCCWTSILS